MSSQDLFGLWGAVLTLIGGLLGLTVTLLTLFGMRGPKAIFEPVSKKWYCEMHKGLVEGPFGDSRGRALFLCRNWNHWCSL